MSELLSGKVAFITGGARGIGRATALKLASAGCDVAIAYHNSHEEAESVCAAIRAMGRRALATQADVSDAESVGEAFAELRQLMIEAGYEDGLELPPRSSIGRPNAFVEMLEEEYPELQR